MKNLKAIILQQNTKHQKEKNKLQSIIKSTGEETIFNVIR